MTPQRLQRLLRGRSAEEVFADLRAPRARLVSRLMHAERAPGHGNPRTAEIVDTWRRASVDTDPAFVWERLVASNTVAYRRGSPGYPSRLVDDRAAPEVVFCPRVDRSTGPALCGSRGHQVSDALRVWCRGRARSGLVGCRCGRRFRPGCRHRRSGSRGSARARAPCTARGRRRWGSRRGLPRQQQPALGPFGARRGHPLRSGTGSGTGKVALPPSQQAHRGARPCRSCRRVPQGGRSAAHGDGRGRTWGYGARGAGIGEEPRVRRHQLPHCRRLRRGARRRRCACGAGARLCRQQLRAWSAHRAMRTEGLCSEFPAGGHRPSLTGRACRARGSRRCCDSVRAACAGAPAWDSP